jgi:DNA-binding LacI/PurR family transcriptional regulator
MTAAARKQNPEPITLQRQLEIAAAALTDPRTVARFLRGERVRNLTAERIRVAAAKLGYVLPVASEPTKAA